MVVKSQSTWRSSQGDFNDPDIPVRMISKMAFIPLLADSFVFGLRLSILIVWRKSMSSPWVVLSWPAAL